MNTFRLVLGPSPTCFRRFSSATTTNWTRKFCCVSRNFPDAQLLYFFPDRRPVNDLSTTMRHVVVYSLSPSFQSARNRRCCSSCRHPYLSIPFYRVVSGPHFLDSDPRPGRDPSFGVPFYNAPVKTFKFTYRSTPNPLYGRRLERCGYAHELFDQKDA
jgi:hypothetical protein